MNEVIHWLALLYRADVLGEGNAAAIMRKFAEHLARKPSMADAARSRREELARVVASRGNSAYIEKKQVDYLDKAIAGIRRADVSRKEEAPSVGAAG